MRVLVLFDIDGTLISTKGQAFAALLSACRQYLGFDPPTSGYSPAGRTDPQIVAELLARAPGDGLPDEAVGPILARYRQTLRETLLPSHVRLLPGVRELLPVLASNGCLVTGLLTGNIEEGARYKLELAGIANFFTLGAYGSDHADRNQLLPVAWERAREALGESFPPERTVVVGDTPADVECAKVWGARAIAVAGHTHPPTRLVVAGPDAVLPSLHPGLFLPVLFAVVGEGGRL